VNSLSLSLVQKTPVRSRRFAGNYGHFVILFLWGTVLTTSFSKPSALASPIIAFMLEILNYLKRNNQNQRREKENSPLPTLELDRADLSAIFEDTHETK